LREVERLDAAIRLVEDTQKLATKPKERRLLLAELATVEARLERMRQRMLEAVLVELLWQYQDFVEGSEAGYVVRQLIADIGTKGND
jgi:hypothetical protein